MNILNRFTFILLMNVLMAILFSCKEEAVEAEVPVETGIVDEWLVESWDITVNGEVLSGTEKDERASFEKYMFIRIQADSTFKIEPAHYSWEKTGFWSLDGDKIHLTFNDENEPPVTYRITSMKTHHAILQYETHSQDEEVIEVVYLENGHSFHQ